MVCNLTKMFAGGGHAELVSASMIQPQLDPETSSG